MAYGTMMAYIEADLRPEKRVRIALTLADKLQSLLIGIAALPIAAFGGGRAVFGGDDVKSTKAQLAEAGNWFRGIAGDRKVEWRQFLEFPVNALPREARSADLVIIGKAKRSVGEYAYVDAGEAVLQMGRQTLVVPDGVSSLRAENIIVGWKDTREARRAVLDALPFLHEAERVTIVEFCGRDEESVAHARIDDVARYLTRHRINGGRRVILQRDGSGAAQLIRLAQEEGADLLVTGAYGRARLDEFIFGGMTRDLLATSPICCLMSH